MDSMGQSGTCPWPRVIHGCPQDILNIIFMDCAKLKLSREGMAWWSLDHPTDRTLLSLDSFCRVAGQPRLWGRLSLASRANWRRLRLPDSEGGRGWTHASACALGGCRVQGSPKSPPKKKLLGVTWTTRFGNAVAANQCGPDVKSTCHMSN